MTSRSAVRFGVSYFGVRDPRHACRDLDEIAAAGFSGVTHTFSEYDMRYHLDDVANLVDQTRARGMEAALDPWGVAGVFGGEAYSELALTELSSRQIDAAGRSVPACCPNAQSTRDLLRRWARLALGLGADVLFWDEPHFFLGALSDGPSSPCCRCRSCREAWAKLQDGPFPEEGDEQLARFRADSLRALLDCAIEETASEVRHSLCLLPKREYANAATDSWETFTRMPALTRLATDPYWMNRSVDPLDFVREHTRTLRPHCLREGREMEIWIQGIRIPKGRESTIREAARVAIEEGADRVAFWSFRGSERMSWLACADPDAAWREMKEAVRAFG